MQYVSAEGSEAGTPPEIEAGSAVLLDSVTGIVLYEHNPLEQKYPASITKVMTALLALEKCGDDLDQRIVFSANAVDSVPPGYTHIYMAEGETLSLRDALYALLLVSANEVANAIAEHVGGDIESFAEMMNRKADQLGAVNTHFQNPSGLHDEEHYTCAYDMALILNEAIGFPVFREIISTAYYEVPPTERHPEIRELNNSNKLILEGQFFYENTVGGKTGFTTPAMHTLVSYAVKGGHELICVTLDEEKDVMYVDTAALFEYGFGCYRRLKVFDREKSEMIVAVYQPNYPEDEPVGLSVMADRDVYGEFPAVVTPESITKKITIPPDLRAPVVEGDTVGSIVIYYRENEIDRVNLLATESIEAFPKRSVKEFTNAKPTYEEELKPVLGMRIFIGISLFLLFLIVLAFTIRFVNIRRRRRRTIYVRPKHMMKYRHRYY